MFFNSVSSLSHFASLALHLLKTLIIPLDSLPWFPNLSPLYSCNDINFPGNLYALSKDFNTVILHTSAPALVTVTLFFVRNAILLAGICLAPPGNASTVFWEVTLMYSEAAGCRNLLVL